MFGIRVYIMADLQVHKNFLVDNEDGFDAEKHRAKKKWMEYMLQEKKSIVAGLKQSIEDLLHGKIKQLESNLIMYEAEVKFLESQLRKINDL